MISSDSDSDISEISTDIYDHDTERLAKLHVPFEIMAAMFEDEIVVDEVYIPPQFEECSLNIEGEGVKLIKIKIIRGHTGCINSASFCSNDERLLSCASDGTIRVWNSADGKELVQYNGVHDPGTNISRCSMSCDSNRIVSCGWDKKVRMIDAETGQFLWTGEHRGIVMDCNFSHDGKLVVSGSDLDKSVKLWEASSGRMIKELTDLHTSTITSCKFDHKDARIITTSMDKTCKLWDMKSGINTITLSAHNNVVSNCHFTENGQLMATCGWDKLIYLWDITTGMYRSHGPKVLEKVHEGCVSSVEFSRDGAMIISGAYDNQVVIWDTADHSMKLKLQGHDDWITDVSFSRSGNWILSASKDQTLRLWNIQESDKIPVVQDQRKTVGLRISTCSKCKKPFSVAMLDESKTPGQNLCVFCRMEARPTIWSVVDSILNTEDGDADVEVTQEAEEEMENGVNIVVDESDMVKND